MDETGGWRFAQAFGDKGDIEEITEADIISAVSFDATGNFLATGDKGGRVVLFERNQSKQRAVEYKFYTEFQSHEPEFDYLRSSEIEEKINKIRWCGRQNSAHFLLSTNDKTIKLWKVFEKTLKVVSETNHYDAQTGRALPTPIARHHLRLPRSQAQDTIVAAVPRKVYANAHAYHIHSISVNSDQETYISADDLRINLWNLNVHDQSFNIVDIKPANMEELTEVITCASFHPLQCNLFMYASSKAVIRMGDLREAAVCDVGQGGGAIRRFEDPPDPSTTSFFSEIISSISDAQFSPDGMHIPCSRCVSPHSHFPALLSILELTNKSDYLTLKLWDIRNEARPLRTISVHDHLKSKLCDLYENDCIFDKWECKWGAGGKSTSFHTLLPVVSFHFLSNNPANPRLPIYRQCLTGSYTNHFRVFDTEGDNDVVLQADKAVLRMKKGGMGKSVPRSLREAMQTEPQDFNKKILHASWHPREATVAIAATNSLFIYSAV
ncbi:Protein phosphatase PP2A regulatory subunit B [Mycena sanguinolenta]|uniref:Protein phosphatase PP2A regulatory subunit B n=1 Tax=Mycena sanguinolenta TaxID=230812 RepID=A0A8H6YZT7_9AGAR|nr:Protein phosphatase PP2A regulatory subunit B [Mycena sanguinolenta]